jgi:exonuclease III
MSRRRLAHNRTPPAPNLSTAVPTTVHCSLNINGINKSIKQSQLNTMRTIQDWKVLHLTDTRVYKAEEIPKIEKSLGVISGFWSLGSPHCAGTAILFFVPVNILASYNGPKGRYTRVDYV